MRRLTLLSLTLFALSGIASAQLSVKQNGRIQVGPFKAQYDRPPLDSLLTGFSLNPTADASASVLGAHLRNGK